MSGGLTRFLGGTEPVAQRVGSDFYGEQRRVLAGRTRPSFSVKGDGLFKNKNAAAGISSLATAGGH